MRKGSIPRPLAVDAACIIGGFIAGMAALQLLSAVLDANPAGQAWLPTRAAPSAAAAQVNRPRKADRLDLAPFSDRFAEMSFASAGETRSLPQRDDAGSVLFWIDPATNTTIVPKSVAVSDATGRDAADPRPLPGRYHPEKEIPDSSKIIGCEPVASPLVDPALARLAGRCLAQLDTAVH